jgi:hypothetical protein
VIEKNTTVIHNTTAVSSSSDIQGTTVFSETQDKVEPPIERPPYRALPQDKWVSKGTQTDVPYPKPKQPIVDWKFVIKIYHFSLFFGSCFQS